MKTQVYNTALYMRISIIPNNQDGDTEVNSIANQRAILQKYARENGFKVYDEYIDAGYSGTNFDRPAFKRMQKDWESGKINCIITKDLSRLGREHIYMGYLTECVFPELNIRYIAINDGFDSASAANNPNEMAPFKTLFNEWYARDTSHKIKSVLMGKYLAGEHFSAFINIGYKRDPDKKNAIVVDDETSWIVKKIFDLADHGVGPVKLARILYEEKVPTPRYLQYLRSGSFASEYENAPENKPYMWSGTHVRGILKNEVYIGNTVHCKVGNVSYKVKKLVSKPEDEWIRVENTHEALISKEVFYHVQQLIDERRRSQKTQEISMFAGLLKCADCGRTLAYACSRQETKRRGIKEYRYFQCTRYAKPGESCTAHYIRYEVLYDTVLSRLQYWTKEVQQNEKALLNRLLKSGNKERAANEKRAANALKKAERRQKELDVIFAKLYEDNALGRLDERNYIKLSEKCQKEQSEVAAEIEALSNQINQRTQDNADAEKWIELLKQYSNLTELTAELMNTLIDKIVVHEATKVELVEGQKPKRVQEIEIHYRFVGRID